MSEILDALLRGSPASLGAPTVRFTSVVNNEFKWGQNAPAFSGIYLGTNDYGKVRHLYDLVGNLSALGVDPEDIHLISIVGGLYYFRLVEVLRPGRITLFDSNIMEHVKISIVANYLAQTKFDDFDNFRRLNEIWSRDHRAYQPQMSGDLHQLKISPAARHTFEGISVPVGTIFPPDAHPELSWRPNRTAFDLVKRSLIENTDRELHFSLPKIDAKGKIAIVYVSNALWDPKSCLTSDWVKKQVSNSVLCFPLHAEFGRNESVCDEIEYAQYILDNLASDGFVLVSGSRNIPAEGRYRHGSHTVTLEEFTASPGKSPFRSVVLGRIISDFDGATAEEYIAQLERALILASGRYQRIIVWEENPHGHGVFGMRASLSLSYIKFRIRRILERYRLSEEVFFPNGIEPEGNVFICFDHEP